jgi:hypothetical protein
LTQKIARHPSVATRIPPMVGPDAAATPNTPAHRPKARARPAGSVMTLVMVERALGCIMAPPTAWTMRKASRVPRLGASEQASDPAAKTARPIWDMRRRPIRSPVDPASSNSEAKTRV